MSKRKYNQNDLRRLMQEEKLKALKKVKSQRSETEKIESPLAKYENDQLMCILCKSVVRSESVWKVHINSKNHKEKVAIAKKGLEVSSVISRENQKTADSREVFKKPEVPEKKTKIENSSRVSENTPEQKSIPSNFFDEKPTFFTATLNKTSIKRELVNIKRNSNDEIKMEVDENLEDEKLPEGFFDDPVKDAKIRNTEYKDPQAEEWERFQREIKEETTHSVEIIAGEHEEAIAERQIEEIDEQIQNWSRVLDMEKKKETVLTIKNQLRSNMDLEINENESDDDDVDLNNLADWRTKKLKLKK